MARIRSGYFNRLLGRSIALCLIPILLLGAASYAVSARALRGKIVERQAQLLSERAARVDKELDVLRQYYMLVASDSALQRYLYKPMHFTDYLTLKKIQNSLSGLFKVTGDHNRAYIMDIRHDWVLGADGHTALNDKPNRAALSELLARSGEVCYWTYMPVDERAQRALFGEYLQLGFITLVIRLPLSDASMVGALVVNLSAQQFHALASRGAADEAMYILHADGTILYHTDAARIGDRFDFDDQPALASADGVVRSLTAELEGAQSFVTYVRSAQTGWIYCAYSPADVVWRDLRAIGVALAGCCLMMLAISLVMTYVNSRHLYAPIGELRSALPGKHEGKNEMQLMRQGIERLCSDRSELMMRLERQNRSLRELLFWQLAAGALGEEEVEASASALGLDTMARFHVASVAIDPAPGEADAESVALVTLQNVFEMVLEERLPLGGVIRMREGRLAGILTAATRAEAVCALAQMLQAARAALGREVVAGLSEASDSLRDLRPLLRQSDEALLMRAEDEGGRVYEYDPNLAGRARTSAYPAQMERDMLDAVKQGDAERSRARALELSAVLSARAQSTYERYLYFSRAGGRLIELMQDSGAPLHAIGRMDLAIREAAALTDEQSLTALLAERLIPEVLAARAESGRAAAEKLLADVLAIIHAEYDTDLTIQACADRLHYHPSYIWRVLKSEMNTTFTDYLTNHRMEMAKRMLREGSARVADIARKLGYNNTQNFIRAFKRVCGTTPGQYSRDLRA